jgi:hypothetical protein
MLSNSDHKFYKIQLNQKILWFDYWSDISVPMEYEVATYCFDSLRENERLEKDEWNVV